MCRPHFRLLFPATVALLLTPCQASPSADRSMDHDGDGLVRAALDSSVAAWNRGDLDAHVAIYADSAVLLPATVGRGPAQARRTLAAFFADPPARPRFVLDSLHLAPLGASHVLLRPHVAAV